MEKEKTLDDILVNQTLSTDRIEMAIETARDRIVDAVESSSAPTVKSSGHTTTVTPITMTHDYSHHLINMEQDLSFTKAVVVVIASIAGLFLCVLCVLMWNVIGSIRSLENGTWVDGKYEQYIEEKEAQEASGSEQNTSTEGASSPQTNDQSNQQPASGESLPQNSGPEGQESGQ